MPKNVLLLLLTGLILIWNTFSPVTGLNNSQSSAECLHSIKADVLFMLDSSRNVEPFEFDYYLKGYVLEFIKRVTISPTHIRIGVVYFSDRVALGVPIKNLQEKTELLKSVSSLPYIGGLLATNKAFYGVAKHGFPKNSPRLGKADKRVVIVLTSGSESDIDEIGNEKAIHDLHNVVDLVVSIGVVKDADVNQRKRILDYATNKKWAYLLNSFTNLTWESVNSAEWTCEKVCQVNSSHEKQKSKVTSTEKDTRIRTKLLKLKSSIQMLQKQKITISNQLKYYKNMFIQSLHANRPRDGSSESSTALTQNAMHLSYIIHKVEMIDNLHSELENLRINSATNFDKLFHSSDRSVMGLNSSIIKEQRALDIINQNIVKLHEELSILLQQDTHKNAVQLDKLRKLVGTLKESIATTTRRNSKLKQLVVDNENKYKISLEHVFEKINQEKFNNRQLIDEVENFKVKTSSLESLVRKHELELEKLRIDRQGLLNELQVNNRTIKELLQLMDDAHKEWKYEKAAIEKLLHQLSTVEHLTEVTKTKEDQIGSKIVNIANKFPLKREATSFKQMKKVSNLRGQVESSVQAIKALQAYNKALNDGIRNCLTQLIFSVRSRSVIQIATLYSDEEGYNDLNLLSSWYKNPVLHGWTKGAYQEAHFVLRQNNRTVVRLVFDARNADRWNWFQREFLVDSYPWPAHLIKENTKNGQFSMRSNGNRLFTMTKASDNCVNFQSYMEVIDGLGLCAWENRNNTFPLFFYTLDPSGMPGNLPTRLLEADEFQIYVKPWVYSFENAPDHTYPLLFAIGRGVGQSAFDLIQGNLSSAPDFLPIYRQNTGTGKIPLCQCWYKNPAMNAWTSPGIFGFNRLVIDLLRENGTIGVELVFDISSASLTNWFRPNGLQTAIPWDVEKIADFFFRRFLLGDGEDRLDYNLHFLIEVGESPGPATVGSSIPCLDRLVFLVVVDGPNPCFPQGPYPKILAVGSSNSGPSRFNMLEEFAQINIWVQ